MGLDVDKCRLLSWMFKDDLEEGNVSIPMTTLGRYPMLRLRTDLYDVHFYIFRKSVLITDNDYHGLLDSPAGHDLFSIREDFVPQMIRRQLGSADHYRCEAYIIDSGYCLRANTLSALAECGKQLTRIAASNNIRLISQAAVIGNKAQIGGDSMIGDHSRVGDKSSVKRSVIGNHVQMGSNVKVSNSIVLDGAIIEDGVKLEGCIVGYKSHIQEKSYLKDCDVGGEHLVEKETTCKGEVFGGSREIYLDDDHY